MASKEELKWRAQSDADTLMRYQEIANDKARYNAAVKAAKSTAAELTSRANAFKKVASKKK